MLRRAQTITLKPDDETEGAEPAEKPVLPQRPSLRNDARRRQQTLRDEFEAASALPASAVAETSEASRPRIERRSLDDLRAEAMSILDEPEQSGAIGGLFSAVPWRTFLKPWRLALIGFALVTGGVAAWLATHAEAPAPQPVVQVAAPAPQPAMGKILVAKKAIGIGQHLGAGDVDWQDWPEASMLPQYVTQAASPDAMTEMASAVARFDIFPGEPIRQDKLLTGSGGYLSAVLGKGMKGVSVSVSAEAASGGYVVPNDHVDVVLTRVLTGAQGQVAETILHNVRVVSIGAQVGDGGAGSASAAADTEPTAFTNTAIATLEVSETQSQVLINATTLGKLSLVLRSMTDFSDAAQSEDSAANQAIRMTSPFWSK